MGKDLVCDGKNGWEQYQAYGAPPLMHCPAAEDPALHWPPAAALPVWHLAAAAPPDWHLAPKALEPGEQAASIGLPPGWQGCAA